MSPWLSDALLRTQSDERLVALARADHERAFVVIVERYRSPLLAFTRRLAPGAPAEDVLQQAFLNAWAALGRGAEVRHLRGWLHQIVRNAALATVRSPGEDPLPDTMFDNHDTPTKVEERLLIQQTLQNLARLPDHQREAIVKTAMEGLSREEIASSLGVSEGAVRAMLHRARCTLRAAATAITPLPLAIWAAGAGGASTAERVADVAAGAGAGGLAAAASKAGTVVVVAGAVATTVVGDRLPLVHHRRTPTQAPTALQHVQRKAAVVAAAPVQVAAVQTSPSSSARRHVLRASATSGATSSHRLVVKQRATSSAPVRRSFEPSHSAEGDSSAGSPPRRASSHSNHDDQSESRRHAAAASAADEQDGSGSSSSSQDSSNQKSAPEDTNTVGDAAPTPTSGASPQD